jgi:cyclohexadienyl dehydratase
MERRRVRVFLNERTLSLCAALMLVWLPAAAVARPLSDIQSTGTLRVGLTGDYAPYSLRDAGGKILGADVVMAHSLARTLGVRLEIIPTAWTSLKSDLQADRFDIAMGGVSVTADRAAIGDFSIPVIHDGKRPIVRCADVGRYTSLGAIDVASVRVVVNPGGTNERFAKANLTHAAVSVHGDNRTIFDEIAAGRADVMVTDGAEVDYQARRHPGALCPAAVADTFDHFDKAYWMSRDAALKEAVDAWLRRSLDSGHYVRALAAAAAD